MTVDINIYCRKEPEIDYLVQRLKCRPGTKFEGYESNIWTPEGGEDGIAIVKTLRPAEIYSETYSKETVDDMIEQARDRGTDVPQELVDKFQMDNIGDPTPNADYVISGGSGTIQDPSVAETNESDDSYTIRADSQLADILERHPQLLTMDPWLIEVFGVAKHMGGSELYLIELECTEFATIGTKHHMTELASYLASQFDGVIYEDQTNKFGKPDPQELHGNSIANIRGIAGEVEITGTIYDQPEDFVVP